MFLQRELDDYHKLLILRWLASLILSCGRIYDISPQYVKPNTLTYDETCVKQQLKNRQNKDL